MLDSTSAGPVDFCWEGRLGVIIGLLFVLYIFTILRILALRGITITHLSPRGISRLSIIAATVLLSVYAATVVWNYSVWYHVRGIYFMALREKRDELLDMLRSIVPRNRKKVSFAMRMLLVTSLWFVKFSFVVIYYEFKHILPKFTKRFLDGTTASIGLTYVAIWAAMIGDMKRAIEREAYSPAAGAGIVLFTPINTWFELLEASYNGDPSVPSLLTAEIVITSLNAFTDLLLLLLIFCIFRHLHLAPGRTQFRAARLLTILFLTTILIALARLGILISGMKYIYTRLAFDTLTDFEAFIACTAACIPATRVLVRGQERYGVPESWCRLRRRRRRRGRVVEVEVRCADGAGKGNSTSTPGVPVGSAVEDWDYVSDTRLSPPPPPPPPPPPRANQNQNQWNAGWTGGEEDDIACVRALSPVGAVAVRPGRDGAENHPAEFEAASWTELAARGIR